MSPKTRVWALLTGLVCIAVLMVGVVGGLLPQLTSAGATFALVGDTRQRNDVSRTQIAALQEQQGRLAQLTEELEELRTAIPDTAASAAWLRQLAEIEQASGASVTSFHLSTPTEGAGAEATGGSEGAEAADAEDASDAASADAPAEGDAGAASGDAGGSSAGAPAPGVLIIPFELVVTGDEAQVTEFVRLLQTGERLVTVRRVTQLVSDDGWQATVSGELYVSRS